MIPLYRKVLGDDPETMLCCECCRKDGSLTIIHSYALPPLFPNIGKIPYLCSIGNLVISTAYVFQEMLDMLFSPDMSFTQKLIQNYYMIIWQICQIANKIYTLTLIPSAWSFWWWSLVLLFRGSPKISRSVIFLPLTRSLRTSNRIPRLIQHL